ncbi:hypothetical protein J3R74_002499 [Puniceicoccus vermicola]
MITTSPVILIGYLERGVCFGECGSVGRGSLRIAAQLKLSGYVGSEWSSPEKVDSFRLVKLWL